MDECAGMGAGESIPFITHPIFFVLPLMTNLELDEGSYHMTYSYSYESKLCNTSIELDMMMSLYSVSTGCYLDLDRPDVIHDLVYSQFSFK
jgi:hypothetical protein